jgi:hypothetical protein
VKATVRYRTAAFVALLATVLLGIGSRRLPLGWNWWDKSLGDALYAVATYLVLRIASPACPPHKLGTAAALFCVAIELFQLTGIRAAHARLPVVRWLVGTQFSGHDLTCYFVGTLAIGALDMLWRRRWNAYT